ncbi:MAG: lipoyl(octanoyl) transferase LipB [Deltaproteobacteria bacterium]|nr:lipoyl(octanoyl) transferase LipB [Deltaproteobacteria bacterium]
MKLVILGGRAPYEETRRQQLKLVEQRKAGGPDTLLLLEHEPVITLGRSADDRGVLASAQELERLGVRVHRVERGGEATYHGPGQIVGYPVVHLPGLGLGVRKYVSLLEEVMIRVAARYGVTAFRKPKLTGAFTAQGKLGAIGVRVTRGVAFHGFAFNVCPDLSHYRLIVPCGLVDTPVASLASILGRAPSMAEAREAIADAFVAVFDVDLVASPQRE